MNTLRKLEWVGSSLKDLKQLPTDVRKEIGFNLKQVQRGLDPDDVKRLTNNQKLKGVMEIRVRDADGTYRAFYTINLSETVYVLHVMQKKSSRGIKTPQRDLDLIAERLKQAKELANEQTTNEQTN